MEVILRSYTFVLGNAVNIFHLIHVTTSKRVKNVMVKVKEFIIITLCGNWIDLINLNMIQLQFPTFNQQYYRQCQIFRQCHGSTSSH